MISSRRAFLTGLGAAFAAPAIVRAASLMPVKVMPSVDVLDLLRMRMNDAYRAAAMAMAENLYGPGVLGSLISEHEFPVLRDDISLEIQIHRLAISHGR